MEPIVQTGYFSEESAKDFIMCITEAIIEQTIDMLVDYGVFIKKGMMRMMKKLIISIRTLRIEYLNLPMERSILLYLDWN